MSLKEIVVKDRYCLSERAETLKILVKVEDMAKTEPLKTPTDLLRGV